MGDYEQFIEYLQTGNNEQIEKHFKIEFLERKNVNSEFPIHIACKNGNYEIVNFFIKKKCNIETANSNGDKPIHIACNNGHLNIVKLLHESKCDMEAEDKSLYKPLHLACQNDKIEIVQFLLEKGCNLESLNINKYTPMHCACQYGNVNVAKLLCKNNCDIESRNYNNDTPLHFVCNNGNIGIVKLLFQYNCNLEAKNSLNKLPIELAAQNGHQNIVEEIKMEEVKRNLFNLTIETIKSCDSDKANIICKTILNLSEFNPNDKIGSGTFGKVFKWNNILYKMPLAIKTIELKNSEKSTFSPEINAFRLNHERIVKYLGSVEQNQKMYIFMELMTGGSLNDKITGPLEISKTLKYTQQCLEGLIYLHENKIIHRDVKPKNILLNENDDIKLCDFGLSRILDTIATTSTNIVTKRSSENAMSFCGTYRYMAPEIACGEKYGYPVDIWSLGVTIIEMITGKPPFSEKEDVAIIFQLAEKKKIEFDPPESFSNTMIEFINKFLDPDPEKRSSAANLLKEITTEIFRNNI